IEDGASPRVAPFAELADAAGLLQRAGFALPVADMDTINVTYENAFALMAELRGMGEANIRHDRRRTPTRRATLLRAAEIYSEQFAGPDGRILYQQHCAACHGDDRLGQIGPALLPENLRRLRKKSASATIAKGRPATQMP
ncbi:MAG: c-type cytochrome, partial [Alphaproteobacteria bacterium]